MGNVSLLRLYALRVAYFLILLFLGATIWPGIIHHTTEWTLMSGVAHCLLASIAVLAAIGIRYPLKMLPLLFFEVIWKATWLIVVAWPLWSANRIDADAMETVKAGIGGVILFPLVIPWPYVLAYFVREPGDRWRSAPRGS